MTIHTHHGSFQCRSVLKLYLIVGWIRLLDLVRSIGVAMARQTVSIMKAAEMTGVSRRTIYNWLAARKVEYTRTAGGSVRIFADTLWRPTPDPAKAESAQR